MNELWDPYDENFNKIKDVVLIRDSKNFERNH